MDRVRERIRGFTLIELIVVIAVIGILATITVVGFGRYQGDTRDARRSSSASVIAEALEKYYDLNGEYPSCAALTASGSVISTTTLKGVDTNTLVAPQAPSADITNANSIKCTSSGSTLTTNGVDFFEYQGDGSPECAASGSCLSFTLKYKDETDGQIKTITSRRSTNIATSGNITNLTANSTSFTSIGLNWSPVINTATYDIQVSLSPTYNTNGFVTIFSSTSSSTNTASITGLSASTTYYFLVRPVSGTGGKGAWSNLATATTRSLATPIVTANVDSGTQITISWAQITFATNYNVQRSTTSGFPADATTTSSSQLPTGVTTQTKTYTDEAPGQIHWYRVQATASSGTQVSDWSTPVQMSPAVVPAAFTITKTDPQYNIERVTSNAVCTAGTVPYYQWFKNGVAWTEGSGASYQTVDAVFPQWNYTLKVTNNTRCQTSTYQSPYVAASNSVSRTLSAPTSSIGNTSYRTMTWDWTCPSGTTSYTYSWHITGSVNKSGSGSGGASTSGSGGYSNTGVAWGSGRGYFTINCSAGGTYGWGTISDSSQGGFGPGCLPMTGSCPP
ncbi:MAG: repeat protein [Candidatus Saccharibacteria bacterium]|nr:repeat protein [Candidatus Saccharibacteria bacterium]